MDGVTVTFVTFQEKQKTDIGIFCPVFTAKTTKMSLDQCILDIQGKKWTLVCFFLFKLSKSAILKICP